MGRVNNALRMLAILRSRKKVSRSELANELEVSVREITRYKDDLGYAGVNIKNTPGRYGGYELECNDYLLSLELSKNELMSLKDINEFLKATGNSLYYDSRSIYEKILASRKIDEEYKTSIKYDKGISVKISYEEERNKWLIINDAILNKRQISIYYKTSSGKISNRIVNPYALFTYYSANFFVGYCTMRKELRNFKLVRIEKINLLKETFKEIDFNIKEYLNEGIGLIGDEPLDISLKIVYPYAQGFKEFKWLNNEEITDNVDEGFIIYKASCKGIVEVTNWILGMGSNCIVISPQVLKDSVRNEIDKMIKMY